MHSPAAVRAKPGAMTAELRARLPRVRPVLEALIRKHRAGWLWCGVPEHRGESVFSHSKRLVRAVGAYGPTLPDFDVGHAAWMAFTHDFAEHVVPDYTPHDRVTREQKFREEEAALTAMVRDLGPGAETVLALWREFEAGQTPEARVVVQLDKLDAAVRALGYDRDGHDVEQFFTSVGKHLVDPRLREAWATTLALRGRPGVNFHAEYYRALAQ